MLERIFENIIEELGVPGLLTVGLYFMLYRPLSSMSRHLRTINDELHELLTILNLQMRGKNG